MVLSILTLVAGILSIALAAIVLLQGTNTKSMRIAYGMFAGSVGAWAIFLGLFLALPPNPQTGLIVVLYYSIGVLIPYAFLLFSLAYLSIPVSLKVRLFALLPWMLMVVLIATPGVMVQTIDAGPAKTVGLVFSTYLLYSSLFIIYVAMGLWLLITKAARAKGVLGHRRIVAASLFVGFAGGGFFDIILPLLGNYNLVAYGPLFAFVTSAGIFYVIARHGLFDIRLTVVRTVNYILSLLTLSGIYLLVAFLILNLLLGQTSLTTQLFFNLGITILLALLFQPVKMFFDRWTNRFFYRYTYNTDEVFATLNRILTSTIDLRLLLGKIAQHIAVALKASNAFFFVYTDERSIQVGTTGFKRLSVTDARWLDDYISKTDLSAVLYGSVIQQDDILRKFMLSYRLALIVPLVQKGKVIGYFCMGEHQKSGYTHRDIRLLNTISNELIIAIENSSAVEEVKNLNATLQQRIDNATSELRHSNAQLQRLDKAKDDFISMASHQLRTPLTSVKGYISMVREGDVGKITKDQDQMLGEAFTSSERMVHLINDFLNVSRLQTGKFLIDKRPVDLAKVIEQELDSLLTNAKSRNLVFTYTPPKDFPILNLDEDKMRQVIMNFSDNAIYYSTEGTKVKVKLVIKAKEAVFTVSDTGIGVPRAEQSQLFTKFYRASNARRQRPDGTGVGLYLAKKVIDAHGGKVVFESVEGQGSTFGFRLPIDVLAATSDSNNLDNQHDNS